MALPNVETVIKNGGLGLQSASKDGVFAIVAAAKKGESNKPLTFGTIADVIGTFGTVEVSSEGRVDNPLVLCADLTFQNGSAVLVLVKAESSQPADLLKAVDTLAENDEIRGVYVHGCGVELAEGLKSRSLAWFNSYRPSFFIMEAEITEEIAPTSPVAGVNAAYVPVENSPLLSLTVSGDEISEEQPG